MKAIILGATGAVIAAALMQTPAEAQTRLPLVTTSSAAADCDIYLSIRNGRTVTIYREVENSCSLIVQENGNYLANFTLQYDDPDGETKTLPASYYYEIARGGNKTHVRISGVGFWQWTFNAGRVAYRGTGPDHVYTFYQEEDSERGGTMQQHSSLWFVRR